MAPAGMVAVEVRRGLRRDRPRRRDERDARRRGTIDGLIQRRGRTGDRGDDAASLVDAGADLGDLPGHIAGAVGHLKAGNAAVGDQPVDQPFQFGRHRHPPGIALIAFAMAPLARFGGRGEGVEGAGQAGHRCRGAGVRERRGCSDESRCQGNAMYQVLHRILPMASC